MDANNLDQPQSVKYVRKKLCQVLVVSFLLLLHSCGGSTTSDVSDSGSTDSVNTFIPDQAIKSESNPMGVYVGLVPAADNSGYHRTLSLHSDFSFTMKDSTEYQGKPKVVNDSGEYKMNMDTVILKTKDLPTLRYLLTDNSLIQLDDEGKPAYPPGTLIRK